ncbi:MAG: addiction module protein [Nitrospinota bacterium]|nr:addiction module protein [Nitrospinota bacterium]
MSNLLKKIEDEVLKLSQEERASLADHLLSSLDEELLVDVDAAWIAEAEQRYQGYKDGNRPGIPAEEVFAEASKLC